jgi:hypothetical protein
VSVPSSAADFIPLFDPCVPPALLPCRADRQKIIDQASLILAEARIIAEHWEERPTLASGALLI